MGGKGFLHVEVLEECIMGNMDLLSKNLTNSMAAYGIASLARWSFGSTPKNLSLHPGPLLASCLLGSWRVG